MSYTAVKIHHHNDKLEKLGMRDKNSDNRDFLHAPTIGTYGIDTHTDGIEYKSREYIREAIIYDTGTRILI